MDSNQLAGKWEQLKGKIQKQWGKLTDDDMSVVKGNKNELIGKLMEYYGLAREAAEKDVKKFMDKNKG